MLPGKVKGIGGAMDLVASPEKTRVIITMVRHLLSWIRFERLTNIPRNMLIAMETLRFWKVSRMM